LDLPWDIEESPSGQAVAPLVGGPRPERELYDLVDDPDEYKNLLADEPSGPVESVAQELAITLDEWRHKTGDVIPSQFAGTQISARYTETYLLIHGREPTSRSGIAVDRGIEHETGRRQY
jgi:hypothetical protein